MLAKPIAGLPLLVIGRIVLDQTDAMAPAVKRRRQHRIGPCLAFEPAKEQFHSAEKYDLAFWANRLLRREYRRPYVLPEKV